MKKHLIITLLASALGGLLSTPATAQTDVTYKWAKSIGSTADDYGYSIATDASGNEYVTGKFGATAELK